jgi:hypothetical protein
LRLVGHSGCAQRSLRAAFRGVELLSPRDKEAKSFFATIVVPGESPEQSGRKRELPGGNGSRRAGRKTKTRVRGMY